MAVVALFAFALTSCSNDVTPPVGEGTLVINIGGGQERGVQPAISMNTASFALTVTDSLDNNVIEGTLGADVRSVDYRLAAGTYTVRLEARNGSGVVIGSGTERVTVVPGGTNVVTVTVREASGDGVFAVSISANEGYGLTLKVTNLLDEVEYSGSLVYSDGRFSTDGAVALSNGFYRFEIIRTDTNAVVKADSLRIVKDMTSTYSATFTFTTGGGITIVNEVLDIPAIQISLNKEALTPEETLVAHADISGISDYTVLWYVDGVAVGTYGAYADLELPLTGKDTGTHEVALYVKNSSVIWAESKEFSIENNSIDISTLSPDQWLDIDPDKTYSFVNMDDGSMYAIDFQEDDGRSIGLSRGADEALILDTGSDRLLVPDEDRKNSGKGSSYGNGNGGQMRVFHIDVANPNNTDALSIEFNENDFSADVCDEWNERERNKAYVGAKKTQFYHVNFHAQAFRNLDPSRIFLVVEDEGGSNMGGTNWGIVTLGNGINQDCYPIMYMYDFSNVPFINIYHEVEAYFTQDRWEGLPSERRNSLSTVLILNPVDLSYGNAVSFGNRDRIFCIPEASDDKEYVLEVTGCDLGNMIQLTDSTGLDYDFAYCMDSNAENKSYLLGKITEDVFFDLGYFREEGGSFSIREAGPEDRIDAIELDSPEYEYEKTIVLSQSNTRFSTTLPVKAVDDYVPSNLIVSISALDSYGNEVEFDGVSYYFKSAHADGIGSSGNGYDVNPCRHKVNKNDVLKSIEVNLGKRGLVEDLEIVLRIVISDGSEAFMAGRGDSYQATFDVNTAGLNDVGFFIDNSTGEPSTIEKNDIFWYMVEKSIYDNPDSTILDAALAAGDLVESEGFRTDRSNFFPNNSGTELYLEVRTNASGTSTEDKEIYFIYAQYTGEDPADFSTLKCSDLQELVKKKLTFYKGR